MGFLAGKRFLIVGLLSSKSIAAGIAGAMQAQGASLAFTYQNDRFKERVESLAEGFGSDFCMPCDVTNDEEIQTVINTIESKWGQLDGVIHSVAFAPQAQLEGLYHEVVNRDDYAASMDVSSYSLAALTKAAAPLLKASRGSVVTLTYYGAEKVVTNYNVMGVAKAALEANVRYLAASLGPEGVRINAISAGPIKTLAASGIKHMRTMLKEFPDLAPLRQNVTIEQVGNTAAFLCSDLASGITGEVVHVDSGYHVMGMGL